MCGSRVEAEPSSDLGSATSLPQKTVPLTRNGAGADGNLPAVAGYELLGVLGRGGMGIVYKARQKGLNRLVALKMILSGAHAAPEERARFRREAEVVARMQHPNVVQIHDIGEQDGCCFFSQELVEGGSLAQRLGGTPRPAHEAAQLLLVLAQTVHAAHERSIVHRDLKPGNILLTGGPDTPLGQCIPKVADFGLAKPLDQDGEQTRIGDLLGTPSYMAPEQAVGDLRKIGPQTDVYALGAILYEMLTGRPPFRGPTGLDTLEQVRTQEPVAPRRLQPKVPRDLEIICLTCLEKEPARRYASAAALADDLRRFLNAEPIQARAANWGIRAWLWSCRLERIRDAGAFMVFLGVVLTAWCLCGLVLLTLDKLRPEQPAHLVRYLLGAITGFYLPMILIGSRTIARRLWALWAGALLSLVIVALFIAYFAGYRIDMGGVYNELDPAMDLAVNTMLLILFAIQFGTYFLALVAYYANRGSLRWSRRRPV